MKAIEFNHVGKQYRLGVVSTGTFSHDLNRWWAMNVLGKDDPYLKIGETNVRSKKGESDFVWALKDINFSVEQGDVVGIIGKNGAGKSTLLKLLSRVTAPTVGEINVCGRIASLLEVGTGFHPEMTGRENIYMNGAIMGMTKAEITRKLDEIIDFSGCERYIDTPVKRYSSGMKVRLGFSVAAHLEPEILVVDEVLAVGDVEFQKKAIGKMQDVSKGGGRTVLFVSHNMAAVQKLCKRGILLEDGAVKYSGGIEDTIRMYIDDGTIPSQSVFFDDLATAPGNDKVRIKSFEVLPVKGNVVSVASGIHFRLTFMNYFPTFHLDAAFELRTADEIIIFNSGKVVSPQQESKIGEYVVEFSLPPFMLNRGKYYMTIWMGEKNKYRICEKYSHPFMVEDAFPDDPYLGKPRLGILKMEINASSQFREVHGK
ncbi:ABC transporter ATP-binding protein [Prevotella sp. P6B4]|uniref:ABC transporter ATP-binding protein n=1 Tax=Prevotella sp. P6B4 TaxID=1410614 RepID=UPI00068619F5|nr:ABC transporter ATP-binding protein [Prevotella sp. P6B4]